MRINKNDQIRRLLEMDESYKEDDNKLFARFVYDELKLKGIDPKTLSALDLLTMLSKGKITHFETIRRGRQKLQSENPHLRGKNYDKRARNDEQVRLDLGYVYSGDLAPYKSKA